MRKLTLYTLLALGIISFATVGVASAESVAQVQKVWGPGGMHGWNQGNQEKFALVPNEMRQEFRGYMTSFKNMTPEERAAFKGNMRANMQKHHADMETFTGLTHEEIMEAKQSGLTMGEILTAQGKTKADAEVFLTNKANERVTAIVEQHDLNAAQEQTLRDRIAQFVQNVLSRWFPA